MEIRERRFPWVRWPLAVGLIALVVGTFLEFAFPARAFEYLTLTAAIVAALSATASPAGLCVWRLIGVRTSRDDSNMGRLCKSAWRAAYPANGVLALAAITGLMIKAGSSPVTSRDLLAAGQLIAVMPVLLPMAIAEWRLSAGADI